MYLLFSLFWWKKTKSCTMPPKNGFKLSYSYVIRAKEPPSFAILPFKKDYWSYNPTCLQLQHKQFCCFPTIPPLIKPFWSYAFLQIALIDVFNQSLEKKASALSEWLFALCRGLKRSPFPFGIHSTPGEGVISFKKLSFLTSFHSWER